MTLSLGSMYLGACLAQKWIKERGTSCLKIGGELSWVNCPGDELSRYRATLKLDQTVQEKHENFSRQAYMYCKKNIHVGISLDKGTAFWK